MQNLTLLWTGLFANTVRYLRKFNITTLVITSKTVLVHFSEYVLLSHNHVEQFLIALGNTSSCFIFHPEGKSMSDWHVVGESDVSIDEHVWISYRWMRLLTLGECWTASDSSTIYTRITFIYNFMQIWAETPVYLTFTFNTRWTSRQLSVERTNTNMYVHFKHNKWLYKSCFCLLLHRNGAFFYNRRRHNLTFVMFLEIICTHDIRSYIREYNQFFNLSWAPFLAGTLVCWQLLTILVYHMIVTCSLLRKYNLIPLKNLSKE